MAKIPNPTYNSWRQAKRRCEDPRAPSYANYGGRGIRFLIPSWEDIVNAIGPRPDGSTIDRIDSNKDYTIENIRWATRTQQNRNRTNVKCTKEIAEEIKQQYRRGRYPTDIAKALNQNIHTVLAVIKGKRWIAD